MKIAISDSTMAVGDCGTNRLKSASLVVRVISVHNFVTGTVCPPAAPAPPGDSYPNGASATKHLLCFANRTIGAV
jgi:hypothetical protein